MVNIPKYTMGEQYLDFSPVTNALAAYRNQANQDRAFQQGDKQFQATNALARAQLGIQQQAAARAEAEAQRQAESRAKLQQFLGNAQFEGIPEPLVGIVRATGDVDPLTDYYKVQAKSKLAQNTPEGYGKAGAVFEDPATGQFRAIQFGERGNLKTHDLTGMRPSRGVKQVGDELVSQATGETVRNVRPQLENKEAAEKVGAARGQAAADLDRKQSQAQAVLKTIRQLRDKPGLASNFGLEGLVPNRRGGAAADADVLLQQIRGQAFLEAFNSIRGGGAITEAEGDKATAALLRAQNSQSYKSFIEALSDFEYQVQTGMELAKRQAGVGGPSGNVGIPQGQPQGLAPGAYNWTPQGIVPAR